MTRGRFSSKKNFKNFKTLILANFFLIRAASVIQRRLLTRHALSDFTYFVTGANFPVGGRVGRRHTFPEVGRRPTSPRGLPPRGVGLPPQFFFTFFYFFTFFSFFFPIFFLSTAG